MIERLLDYPCVMFLTDCEGKILKQSNQSIQFLVDNSIDTEFLKNLMEDPFFMENMELSGFFSAKFNLGNSDYNVHQFNCFKVYDTLLWIIMEVSEPLHCLNDSTKLCPRFFQQQKIDSIGQFVGGLAHDMNNLFTAIIGHASMIRDYCDVDSKTQVHLEKILNCCNRAAGLNYKLLSYQKNKVQAPELCDVNKHITELLNIVSHLFCENIQIHFSPECQSAPIHVAKGDLDQILMNLLINASEALKDGGEISISTKSVNIDKEDSAYIPDSYRGEFILISISDNGPGIPEELLQRIFEPYFTTKSDTGGSGLGLATAYSLTKKQRGWLNVYSEVGVGTTFKLYLPVRSASDIAPSPQSSESRQLIRGNEEYILFVEDSYLIREYVSAALGELGYHVIDCETSKKAYELFTCGKYKFDLIFSDIVLPDGSGLELYHKLSSHCSDLKVLLCSGYSDYKIPWNLLKKGNIAFIAKPFRLDELSRVLQFILHRDPNMVDQSLASKE